MLKKGDVVFVKPHKQREDVICGNVFKRTVGGEFYKFVHYTNSDTAFVARPVSFGECRRIWEKRNGKEYRGPGTTNNDHILVPKNMMIPIKWIA